MATIVGMLLYALGSHKTYELDSSKKLVKLTSKVKKGAEESKVLDTSSVNTEIDTSPVVEEKIMTKPELRDSTTVLTPLEKEKKKGMSKIWSKLSEWF